MMPARRLLAVPLLVLALAAAPAPFLALVPGAAPAWAVEPGEMLDDPALEARARDITREIRCMVCRNQSIDDSDADLARDLRLIVRERLLAGDSDDEVRQYLVTRYGDYVLLDPPVKPETWLLWFGPPLLLAGALLGVGLHMRRRRARPIAPAPLSAAERRRLDALLAAGERRDGGRPAP